VTLTTLPAEEKLIAPTELPPVRDERQQGALRPYLRAIRAHRILVAAVTILSCLAAVAWQAQRAPSYEASAKILLTPLAASETTFAGVQLIRDSNDPTRTAQTAAALIESPQVAQETARRMGPPYTRERVERDVKVRPEGQSNIIAVTARAPEPQLALKLADTYADAALDRRSAAVAKQIAPIVRRLRTSRLAADVARAGALEAVVGDPTLSVSQDAVAPRAAVGAPLWIVALLALVAGFTIAATAALLMENLDRRVRDEHELTAAFAAPVPILARVPKVGDRLFAGGDLTAIPPAVREAFRTVQVQIEQLGPGSRALMVTSASAGDGKTTAAINLALELMVSGHRVLLVDFDVRQPDLTRILGLTEARDVMALAGAHARVADLVVAAPRLPPLLVVPGGTGEAHGAALGAFAQRLAAILAEARELADYVIIDTAPLGRVSDALWLVPHVDEVVVVARLGTTERLQFKLLCDLLTRAGVVPAGIVMVATGAGDDAYPAADG
jgi:Mrp family chromosome partitioning ATPase/capsular polysaccharide biosynthesis protein